MKSTRVAVSLETAYQSKNTYYMKGTSMRLVSLLASATEMIAALGCLDQLVGRSHECDYPPAVLALPVVSTVQINTATSRAQIDAQINRLAHHTLAQEYTALRALSIYAINVGQLHLGYAGKGARPMRQIAFVPGPVV